MLKNQNQFPRAARGRLLTACASLTVALCVGAGSLGAAEKKDAEEAEPGRREAIRPTDGVIKLFNGKDLSGLYTFLRDTRYDDPRNVFSVEDGMLRISGNGMGAILTKKKYRDYHLVCEFKWGDQTWGHRKDRARDSGLLVHCTGPDDAYKGTWPASIESQIIEGGVGDFILVRGQDENGDPIPMQLYAEVGQDRNGNTIWKPGGEVKPYQRRVNWFGRDPDWTDTLGFRGENDVESPYGEWTRLEVICDGDQITNVVNGVVVNKAIDVRPTFGKILLQAELAEIYVRRWELWPLGEAPQFDGPPGK